MGEGVEGGERRGSRGRWGLRTRGSCMMATLSKTEGYMYYIVKMGTLGTVDRTAEGYLNWGIHEGRLWQRSTRHSQRGPIGL